MSTHALFGGKVRYAIVTLALVAVLGGVLAPTTAQALSLAELIDLFIALEIIPADKAVQARSIVSQEKTSPSAACPFTWTRNLTVGAAGPDVQKLQEFLNGAEATKISGTGAGSSGKESTYFGSMTAAAVLKFQDVYASSVLTPVGLKKGTGYFGSATRAKANELCATATVGGIGNPKPIGGDISDVPTIPTGTGLTVVKSATQPKNALLPRGAARVPFTTIELSAGSEAVTVTGITVMRQGLASNNSFAGVVLLDENGTILGNAKTLNTDNQAIVGGTFVVPKGTTKKVTIAANMNADLTLQVGEVPSLAVIGVNTGSTVSATFPIVGAQHTINSSLLIGGVTMSPGSLDPKISPPIEKTVGTKDYVFSSVKVTATANEDVLLKSIRWYQSESASAEDVENVKTILDGVEYTAVRDGRYYQTVFPSTGILIKKGLSKDVSVKADIVSGSGRAIDFDIERDTDINLVGTTYGYGVTPPPGTGTTVDGSVFRASNNPYYDASQVSVSSGTMNVSGWTQVSAANVGTSVIGEKLMGFTVEVRGEPVSVGSMVAHFDITGTGRLEDITNVVLTDANGAILAGPRDGSGAVTSGDITFTESVTFPVGITNVYVKGKLGTDFLTNDTVQVSTDPSNSSKWSSVRGENTSATIDLSGSTNISGPIMTVRGGALTISLSGLPASQTVIAGAQNFEFARYIFDASRSSENIRLSTLPLHFVNVGATRTDLTSCKLYDGATAVTTGGNVKNPAVGETPTATTFTFDNGGFVVPEGSIKTLSLKCNIKSGAASTYQWQIDNGASYEGATGVETGLTINETIVDNNNGPIMTASNAGGYTVSADTSLIYRIVQAGSSDVELARFRFEAGVGEDVSVKQVALELVNTGDNSPTDLQNEKVSLWVGAIKVGEAQFGGADPDKAVATLATPIVIPRGDSVTVSVKGDLATQNAISGTPGAHLTIGYDGTSLTGSIDPAASTAVVGVGTLFTTELVVGDSITVSGETRTVTVIADNTNLTVGVAFTDTANDTSPYKTALNNLDGNYGKGIASGITIPGTSKDVTSNGVRIFRTLPQIEDVTPSNVTLGAGSDLYQVKITASNGRDVGIRSLAFNVTEVGATVDNYQLYGPNGAVNATAVPVSSILTGSIDPTASTAVVGVGTLFITELAVGDSITVSGETRTVTAIANNTNLTVGAAFSDNANDTSVDKTARAIRIVFDDSAMDRVVPANGSKTYRLRANTVSGLTSNNVETLTVALRADTAYPTVTGLMGDVADVEAEGATVNNFVWTPFSVTSPQTGAGINSNDDWTNGYGIPGYPGVGQNMQVRVFNQ